MKRNQSKSLLAQRLGAAALLVLGFVVTIATSEPPCDANSDCGDGFVCQDSSCIPACREDADCPDGQVCTDDRACEPEQEPTCTPGEDCEVKGEGSGSMAAGTDSIGLEVQITPEVFSTSDPSRTRGTLHLDFASPAQPGPVATTWRLRMPDWGIDKQLDVELSDSGANLVALEFGLDPADQPCSSGGGCLLQFELQRADENQIEVDLGATITIDLPEAPPTGAGVSAAFVEGSQ